MNKDDLAKIYLECTSLVENLLENKEQIFSDLPAYLEKIKSNLALVSSMYSASVIHETSTLEDLFDLIEKYADYGIKSHTCIKTIIDTDDPSLDEDLKKYMKNNIYYMFNIFALFYTIVLSLEGGLNEQE